MLANKISIRLINLTILMLIIYLFYITSNLWIGFGNSLLDILLPFLISFVIAYALNPVMRFLHSLNIPKIFSIIIMIALILGILIVIIFWIIPVLFEQLISLVGIIIAFLMELSIKYDLNMSAFQTFLDDSFDKVGVIATTGILNLISTSFKYVTLFFIIISTSFYFLIDFEKITFYVKERLIDKNYHLLKYLFLINNEMRSYLNGFFKIAIISIFEYGIAFLIIGHPNAILLGILSGIFGIIPYFGGVATSIIGMITAFVISPALFVRTLIIFLILAQVDGFLINPLVYGRSNNIHPILVIFSVFLGGTLWGIFGIIISLPLMIIIITTIRYFKNDINDIIKIANINNLRSDYSDTKT